MYNKRNISSTLQTQNMNSKKQRVDDINLSNNFNDFCEFIPSGFKFLPTEQELIMAYLRKKVMNEPLESNLIADVDVYKYNPEQLSRQHRNCGENEWYFFSPREGKYRNWKLRPKRSTEDGYWKATGKCQMIYSEDGFTLIGKWRTLVYYEGNHQKSKKTNWIMREYYLDDSTYAGTNAKLNDWVLCKIYKNNKNYSKISTKEEALLEPSKTELIQKISSPKILPHQSQPQILSQHESCNSLDPIHQLNPHYSSEISQHHQASSNPPYFHEIHHQLTKDLEDSLDVEKSNDFMILPRPGFDLLWMTQFHQ